MSGTGLDYSTRRKVRDFIRLNMAEPLTVQQVMAHFRLKPDDEPDVRELMTRTAILGLPGPRPEAVTPPSLPLPDDLQGRLDTILQRPLFRRAPRLAGDVRALVREAFQRPPVSAAAAAILGELRATGLGPAGRLPREEAGYIPPFETGAPWRGPAEAEWDESRGDAR